jgi:hypothetical protein
MAMTSYGGGWREGGKKGMCKWEELKGARVWFKKQGSRPPGSLAYLEILFHIQRGLHYTRRALAARAAGAVRERNVAAVGQDGVKLEHILQPLAAEVLGKARCLGGRTSEEGRVRR